MIPRTRGRGDRAVRLRRMTICLIRSSYGLKTGAPSNWCSRSPPTAASATPPTMPLPENTLTATLRSGTAAGYSRAGMHSIEPRWYRPKMPRTSIRSRPHEALSYRIELWHDDGADKRVLARAVNLQLARAIFRAATDEHPEARITISRGTSIIADSSGDENPGQTGN
jgi:hypothetical protein